MNNVLSIKRKGRNPVRESAFSHPVNALQGDRGNSILAQNPSLRTLTASRRCFRVSFDGGVSQTRQEARTVTASSIGLSTLLMRVARIYQATFKANSSETDRNSSIEKGSRLYKRLDREKYNGFRPDRTGLRKTPSSWLPANEISKDHPGFVLIGHEVQESPFLSRGL